MENQTQTPTPQLQPLSQTPAPISPKTNWLKISFFIILELVLLTVAVYAGMQLGKTKSPAPTVAVVQPTVTPSQVLISPTTSPTETTTPTPTTSITKAAEPTTTLKPTKITPISTQDWKNVQNDGVFFKIPANATCNDDAKCTEVSYPNVYQGKTPPLPARILVNVTDYLGESRRSQYLAEYKGVQDCRPIYVETVFGSVSALQIAVDGGWCQGGYDGAIVAAVGDKFVVIGPGLSYHENKVITRWNERDTLVSTLTSK